MLAAEVAVPFLDRPLQPGIVPAYPSAELRHPAIRLADHGPPAILTPPDPALRLASRLRCACCRIGFHSCAGLSSGRVASGLHAVRYLMHRSHHKSPRSENLSRLLPAYLSPTHRPQAAHRFRFAVGMMRVIRLPHAIADRRFASHALLSPTMVRRNCTRSQGWSVRWCA